jgi:hypothetical protein
MLALISVQIGNYGNLICYLSHDSCLPTGCPGHVHIDYHIRPLHYTTSRQVNRAVLFYLFYLIISGLRPGFVNFPLIE